LGGLKHVSRQIGGHQTHVFRVPVQPQRPLHFGFSATLPLRVSVVRSDNSSTYGAGIVNHASTTFHPGPSKTEVVTLTVRVENVPAFRPAFSLLMTGAAPRACFSRPTLAGARERQAYANPASRGR